MTDLSTSQNENHDPAAQAALVGSYLETDQYKKNSLRNGQYAKPKRPRLSKKYNDKPRGYTGRKNKLDPNKRHSRLGVPDGMKKPQAEMLWDRARTQAKDFITMLEDGGALARDEVLVPDSDEAKAKAALHEVAVMALGPTDTRTKLMACNTILTFCKQKPVTKVEGNLTANDWLMEAVAANRASKEAFIDANRKLAEQG